VTGSTRGGLHLQPKGKLPLQQMYFAIAVDTMQYIYSIAYNVLLALALP
jgi:hypothetical protein